MCHPCYEGAVTAVRIVPLGGLGEVGMNCLAIESPDGILVIDCGVTFPHDEFGVDIIHPDFRWLVERRKDVVGVVVTHGHEDHIGALPYLLREFAVPVWAPPYALALIEGRMGEHPDLPAVQMRATRPRVRFDVGPFSVEPLRVTHSIPDATALSIDTPAGRIFHTGDFKLEQDPLDNELSDEKRFRALGDDGVALLLSDSTNVDVPGRAGEERSVATSLASVVGSAEGLVIVGIFASNVFRLQTLANIALKNDRKLCFLGRSVHTHSRAATQLGRFKIPSHLLVSPEQAASVPRDGLLVVATGTQAEPVAALPRLARDDHPNLRIAKGDTVIFSSRAIPGNERAIWDLICQLERRGVTVHFPGTDPALHASGHAARDEQSRMIELVRPQSFVPVHGTFHHLKRHAELAREMSVPDVMVLENGHTATLRGGQLRAGEDVTVGRVHIDHGLVVSAAVLEERAAMAATGAVFVNVPLDARGARSGRISVATRGLVADESPDILREIVVTAIDEGLSQARGALDRLEASAARDAIRRAVGRVFKSGRRRPVVVVRLEGE